MSELKIFKTAGDFIQRAETFLEKDEVCNNLLLGLSYDLIEHPMRYGGEPFYAITEQQNGDIELAALMTPPNKLVLYATHDRIIESCKLLIQAIQLNGLSVSNVIGLKLIAERFRKVWVEINRDDSVLSMILMIYKLTKVIKPDMPGGRFRVAEEKDIAVLARWNEEFYSDAIKDARTVIKDDVVELVRKSDAYVWENDNEIVSMAVRRRRTNHGYAIGPVYTPRQYRNRGFATACVGSLCQELLGSGKHFCTLFADVSNPASNRVYQKIGFSPVKELYDYKFSNKKA